METELAQEQTLVKSQLRYHLRVFNNKSGESNLTNETVEALFGYGATMVRSLR